VRVVPVFEFVPFFTTTTASTFCPRQAICGTIGRRRNRRASRQHASRGNQRTIAPMLSSLLCSARSTRIKHEVMTANLIRKSRPRLTIRENGIIPGIEAASPRRDSRDELERAGAYRVYEDTADLLKHIDEVGGRRSTYAIVAAAPSK
jgi:hypothetical protein